MFEDKVIKSKETIIINVPGVEAWSLKELRNCCKNNKVKGYTKMNREQLIEEVRNIIKKLRR